MAIVHDMDGGGRRDLVVGAPGNGTVAGACYLVSAEGGTFPNAASLISLSGYPTGVITVPPGVLGRWQFGTAVLNLGNIDGQPGEEFAVSHPSYGPTEGRVYVYSHRGAFLLNLGYLVGTESFGKSLAIVDTLAGPHLAIGVPGLDQVHLFAMPGATLPSGFLSGPALTVSFPLAPNRVLTRVLSPLPYPPGNLGSSIASGPNGVLAAGAPSYSSAGANGEGYVAVYNLMLPGNSPTAMTWTGVIAEGFGHAVASIGHLPPPAPPNTSPLSDFVVLCDSGKLVLCHSPSTLTTVGPLWYLANVTSLPGTVTGTGGTGHLASLGDIDGDSRGDVALTGASVCRVYSTRGTVLTSLVSRVAAPHAGVASGPDVHQVGGVDIVTGPNTSTPTGVNLRILPFATSTLLPNATGITLEPAAASPTAPASRPQVGPAAPGTYDLVTSKNLGAPELVVLAWATAPVAPVPASPPTFTGGTFYVGPSPTLFGAAVVGPGTPWTAAVPMPATTSLIYTGAVFQSVMLPTSGPLEVSNGVMARLGDL